MKIVKPMYLIHDSLFESLEVAEQHNDGKDQPSLRYVLMDENEAEQSELYAVGFYLFKNEADALAELNEYNN